METKTHKTQHAVTQAWTNDEIALIEELARERVSNDELEELFPGRTAAAARQQLFKMRRALGIPKECGGAARRADDDFPMLKPNDPGVVDLWLPQWTRRAERSNERFLQALAAA